MEEGSARLAPPWRTRSELEDDYYPQGGWDTAFLVTLLLVGLPANGLMAWLAGSQARHRAGKRLALFLLSLAVSDFLFLVATAFQIMEIRLQGHWPLGTAACRFYYFIWGISYSSGLFLLAVLSLDRCLMALFPQWYPCHRPSRLPLWLCTGAWVLATLFSMPWLIFPEANVWWYDLVICLDFWDTEELPLRVLEILGGVLPFLLLLGSHVLTQIQACRLHRQQRRDGRAGPCRAGFSRVASTVLSAYIVLRLPYQLAQLLYLAYLWDFYPGYFLWEALVYSDYLLVLNSCLSPFLCVLASANIRALLHSMLSSFAAALAEEQFRAAMPAASLPAQPEPAVPLQPQVNPMAQLQVNPTAQSQVNPMAQVQMNPTAQSQVNPMAQLQVNPTAQSQVNTMAEVQVNPMAQVQMNPTAQPQVNPMAQLQVNPTAQPQVNSVAQPQVNPMAQPQMNSMAQLQPNLTDQPQCNPTVQSSDSVLSTPTSTSDPSEGPTSSLPTEQPTPAPLEEPGMPPAPEVDSSGMLLQRHPPPTIPLERRNTGWDEGGRQECPTTGGLENQLLLVNGLRVRTEKGAKEILLFT